MEDCLKLCASAFMRNKGKTVFSETEFLMGISMDLRWMPYNDTKFVLRAMLSEGLLEKSGDYLKATFDPASEDVPVAYRPSKELLDKVKGTRSDPQRSEVPEPLKVEEKAEDIMPILMNKAVEIGMDRRDFMAQCNAIRKNLGVYVEAAALIVLRDKGVDIDEYADRAYRSILKK